MHIGRRISVSQSKECIYSIVYIHTVVLYVHTVPKCTSLHMKSSSPRDSQRNYKLVKTSSF